MDALDYMVVVSKDEIYRKELINYNLINGEQIASFKLTESEADKVVKYFNEK